MKLATILALAAIGGCTEYTKQVETTPLEEVVHYILIDKSAQELHIIGLQGPLAQYTISTGKNPGQKTAVGDYRTPEGEFRLGQAENSSNWYFEGKHKVYGPYFFRVLDTDWQGIGIHSTTSGVGKPASRGCIRMKQEDLLEFKTQYYKPNMKIIIQP